MERKHAFLIGVYKCPEYVEILLNMLISERSNIYIHVNKRNWEDFKHLVDKYKDKNVTFIHEVEINWGGSSFMDSVMSLIRISLENKENVYFHLITGQDVLTKPLSSFFSFFENTSKSYISYHIMDKKEVKFRFKTFHFFDLLNINYGKRDFKRMIETFSWMVQMMIPFKNQKLPFETMYQGSPWWSLHRNAIEYCYNYIVNNNIMSRFRNTFAPDESLFHTILMDASTFPLENNNLRYIVWDQSYIGGQKLLQENDFDTLISSETFFARKVDLNDSDSRLLIDKISKYICSK